MDIIPLNSIMIITKCIAIFIGAGEVSYFRLTKEMTCEISEFYTRNGIDIFC